MIKMTDAMQIIIKENEDFYSEYPFITMSSYADAARTAINIELHSSLKSEAVVYKTLYQSDIDDIRRNILFKCDFIRNRIGNRVRVRVHYPGKIADSVKQQKINRIYDILKPVTPYGYEKLETT